MNGLLPKAQRKDWSWCNECENFHLKWARHLNRYEKADAIFFPVYTAPDYQSGISSRYYVGVEAIKHFFEYMKIQGENGHCLTRGFKG